MHTLRLTKDQLDVLDELITAERVRLTEDMARPMHAPEYRETMRAEYDQLEVTREAVRRARDGKATVGNVRLGDITAAAQMDDLDAAAASIQAVAGITDGGVAGMCLDYDLWGQHSPLYRERMLLAWLRLERHHEENPTP